jgi:hypothetical protein
MQYFAFAELSRELLCASPMNAILINAIGQGSPPLRSFTAAG